MVCVLLCDQKPSRVLLRVAIVLTIENWFNEHFCSIIRVMNSYANQARNVTNERDKLGEGRDSGTVVENGNLSCKTGL